jgi:uncharacterized protein
MRPRFHPEATLVRTVLWQRLDEPWVERCTLVAGGPRPRARWILDGTVLGSMNGEPIDIRYGVFCREDWTTSEVAVTAMLGTRVREIELVRDKGRWYIDATKAPELGEGLDVDLGFTPATNTLPIRRLGLDVGDSHEIQVAWVRFPEMTVEPFRQRYTRLSERQYLYESLGGSGFKAELSVDDLGLVVTYPGLWERSADAGDPPGLRSSTG